MKKKVIYGRSIGVSRVIYQFSNAGKNFISDIEKFTSISSLNGYKHQTITQIPRVLIEIVMVISLSLPLLLNIEINDKQILAFVIIVRTLPNFIRIMYNQGNIKAASVSANILEKGLSSKYAKEKVKTGLKIITNNNKGLTIKCNDCRYLDQIFIQKGFGIVVGASGSGKSVLMRNIIAALTKEKYNPLFFSREIINDNLATKLLALDINKRKILKKDIEIFKELNSIVKRKINGEIISTGEAERLILYFVSYVKSDFIVLDEYFLNIEDRQKEKYINLLLNCRKNNYTILITHDKFIKKNKNLNIIDVFDNKVER